MSHENLHSLHLTWDENFPCYAECNMCIITVHPMFLAHEATNTEFLPREPRSCGCVVCWPRRAQHLRTHTHVWNFEAPSLDMRWSTSKTLMKRYAKANWLVPACQRVSLHGKHFEGLGRTRCTWGLKCWQVLHSLDVLTCLRKWLKCGWWKRVLNRKVDVHAVL